MKSEDKLTDSQQEGHYIIAIGFSAGGIEALFKFFDHAPQDSVSYIIIQHLPLDFKSQMVKVLSKHSEIKILEMQNHMPVEKNYVYVMPEKMSVTIEDGKFHLSPGEKIQPNTTIDIFLDSLAIDNGNENIAVILSGTGTDGTKGIASIKKAGGLVIVQDPDTAKFDGMPNSAIESGHANLVLAPEDMPEQILNYVTQSSLVNHFSKSMTENDEEVLHKILELIKDHTPLDFTNYKRSTILRRIARRLVFNNIDSLPDYFIFLKSSPAEIDILSKEFLISVTKFFRNKEAFEVIQQKIIPEIIRSKLMTDTLKVWVIGCATGEEAYSIAILVKEHLNFIKKDIDVRIFATDIDKEAIAFASKAHFPFSIADRVSEERLHNFFEKIIDGYKVNEEIRKMVIFSYHNIIKQPPYAKVDLISCRNLLIYLNPVLQKKILSTLHFCLNLDGYLFLGPSENIGELHNSFLEVDEKWKIYKNIKSSTSIGTLTYTAPGIYLKNPSTFLPSIPSSKPVKNMHTEKIIQAFARNFGSAVINVTLDFKVIQAYGDYKKYMNDKIFNFNLLETINEELSVALGFTLHEAVKENREVSMKEINYKYGESTRSIELIVIPLLSENNLIEQSIVVVFKETDVKDVVNEESVIYNREVHTVRYVKELEDELKRMQERLSESSATLEVSQQNTLSYNEELISSNEEIQSTNEELQSVNEELQTVNNEYQRKLVELVELNDDLTNYFRSSINSQIYVDKNLIIKKFTPITINQINLIENNIGRSLTNISSNIKFDSLIEDIVKVISSSLQLEKEIQTVNGKWYQMVIFPFLRKSVTDGVIITFNDITEIKKAQEIQKEILLKIINSREEERKRIAESLHNGLAQILYATRLHMERLDYTKGKESIDAIKNTVLNLLEESINESRTLSFQLSPPYLLQDFGLKVAIEELITRLHKTNLHITYQENGFDKKLNHQLEFALFRIIQELINNIIKHANATEAKINLINSNNTIHLTITDNGKGFNLDKINNGMGLSTIKNWINLYHGTLSVEPKKPGGAIVKIEMKSNIII